VREHPRVGVYDSVEVALDAEERRMLRCGLTEWGGPARCTEEMAVALGFQGVDDLHATGHQIAEALEAREPLTQLDWVRALLATEVAFASDVVGSGVEWAVTTGLTDRDALAVLRRLQRKIPKAGVVGVAFGTRPS